MVFYKLLLLFWKYLHYRKFQWIITVMEIVVPNLILLFFCMMSSKKEISGESSVIQMGRIIYPVQSAEEFLIVTRQIDRILFSPQTSFTKNIMLLVNETLVQPEIEPFETEETMRNRFEGSDEDYNKFGAMQLGVHFMNVGNDENIPDHLEYRIMGRVGMTYGFDTQHLFLKDDPEDVNINSYKDSGFSGLQASIDAAFIRIKTNVTQAYYKEELFIQLFPQLSISVQRNQLKTSILRILKILLLAAFILQAYPLINTVIEEKESGVKELMKIVGLPESLVWISWFLNTLIFSVISITLITVILVTNFNGPNTSSLQYVDPVVLWFFLILFTMANIMFCFTFSALFHKSTYAGLLYCIISCVVALVIDMIDKRTYYMIAFLFPPGVYCAGFSRLIRFEIYAKRMSWNELSLKEDLINEPSLATDFWAFGLQIPVFMFLAYYINAINPGKFGTRKSPWFIFLIPYRFFQNKKLPDIELNKEVDNKYVEAVPNHLEPSLIFRNIHKKFGSFHAVNGVSLTIYKNEIVALLGPNGAGKTTLMSILTGLTNATSGSIVYDKKLDALKNMSEFRNHIGYCPQEDRLFPYLTVKNHLLFFGRLKGQKMKDVEDETQKFMKDVDLEKKANNVPSSISGGMKRKLCLGISLIGKSEILILDEPTSGIDVQSRRKLWNLLLALRDNRTIILTTHHLEEADVLGDRIAIMTRGTVRCHGTSMFLKKMYNAGYLVHVTKTAGVETQQQITRAITQVLPSAIVNEVKSSTEVVYLLPLYETRYFPLLFENLEKGARNLGIVRIGVSCTTLEDVFIKVSGQFDKDAEASTREASSSNLYAEREKLSGFSLFFQQLLFLIYKKILCFTKDIDTFGYRVIIPTMIAVALMYFITHVDISVPDLELTLSLYSGGTVLLKKDTNSKGGLTTKFQEFCETQELKMKISSDNDNITNAILKYGQRNFLKLRTDFILAAQFGSDSENDGSKTKRKIHRYLRAETSDDNNSTEYYKDHDDLNILMYNPVATHSLGVLVNAYSNTFLRNSAGKDSYSIKTFNIPIRPKNLNLAISVVPAMFELFGWGIALGFYTLDLSLYFSSPLLLERLNGFKHIQYLSRVSPIVYWLSTLVFDAILFLLILGLRWLAVVLIAQSSFLHGNDPSLGMLALILLVSIPGILISCYVFSFITKSVGQTDVFFFFLSTGGLLLALGTAAGQYILVSRVFHLGFFAELAIHLLSFIIHIIPPWNFMLMFLKLELNWFFNTINQSTTGKMDKKDNPDKKYFTIQNKDNECGILLEFIFMCVDIVFYIIILLLMDYGVFQKIRESIKISLFGKHLVGGDVNSPDLNVEKEKALVSHYFDQKDSTKSGFVLLVNNLKKMFVSLRSHFIAVQNVTFSVRSSECFGLLGVNGAGKSTTFKMLVGELTSSKGDASVLNYKLSRNSSKYFSLVGYCAQTNCFVEQLSGMQMLSMMASLKGIPPNQKKKLIDDWLTILGLEAHETRPCGTYSGGNKRKLCTAMALIGNPAVIFLDEPTTGVDPVSRQKLYTVMRESKMAGQSVVLTSHSMEECELLCDRLTIMVGGVMKCIGTSQELKQKYAQGITIQIKLYDMPKLEEAQRFLKGEIIKNFGGQYTKVVDEHEGLLDYRITDNNLQWSTTFSRMESLKSRYKFIEDYIVSDTSLEQVFLSFSQ